MAMMVIRGSVLTAGGSTPYAQLTQPHEAVASLLMRSFFARAAMAVRITELAPRDFSVGFEHDPLGGRRHHASTPQDDALNFGLRFLPASDGVDDRIGFNVMFDLVAAYARAVPGLAAPAVMEGLALLPRVTPRGIVPLAPAAPRPR